MISQRIGFSYCCRLLLCRNSAVYELWIHLIIIMIIISIYHCIKRRTIYVILETLEYNLNIITIVVLIIVKRRNIVCSWQTVHFFDIRIRMEMAKLGVIETVKLVCLLLWVLTQWACIANGQKQADLSESSWIRKQSMGCGYLLLKGNFITCGLCYLVLCSYTRIPMGHLTVVVEVNSY